MNIVTKKIPIHFVVLDKYELEAGDLLELLHDLTDCANIAITDEDTASALKKAGIISHAGRMHCLRAELAEGGMEKANELIAAIQKHYQEYREQS